MKLLPLVCGVLMVFPVAVLAQEVVLDEATFVKAEVVSVLSETRELIPGTQTETFVQELRVEVLEGEKEGEILSVRNDYAPLREGDVFYLRHLTNSLEGRDLYSVAEPYRMHVVFFIAALFVAVVCLFGGWQGVRGLVALALSFFFIAYLLIPGILSGYSPVLVSMAAAALIVVLGSYITHGVNRTTTAAVVGMLATIVATGLLALYSIHASKFTGFASEETTYLLFSTNVHIDFVGLLLGGILIGLLGVLYDAAIGQAVAVEELFAAGKEHSRRHVFTRALRIGREHIGALVNTLAIAYVGASLPLILLFTSSATQPFVVLNQELFAGEILRILVGSIGVVLAVPLTTAVAVYMLHGRVPYRTSSHTHTHSHSH